MSTLAGLAGNQGSADGTGSAARFNRPRGVAVDWAGNVYVADQDNSRIRKGVQGDTPTLPVITAQPQSQTVLVGMNVTFSVTTAGAQPFSYQWQKDATDITGETNAALVLTNVTNNQAGNYTVVVRNAAGSLTSAAASLTLLGGVTPLVLSIETDGAIRVTGVSGRSYRIEYVIELTDTNQWIPLATVVLTNGSGMFVDPERKTNRFYRAVSAP